MPEDDSYWGETAVAVIQQNYYCQNIYKKVCWLINKFVVNKPHTHTNTQV